MCYEYDEYFQQALIAEQMRAKKKAADEAKKQGVTGTPSKPAEPEKRTEEKEPVPA
ncbi:MAG: hypothetical protein HYU75_06945 [Betaproteobacteria bacterium]|nr:hypothetical protein [Betaproteobacteria bacterium]